MNEKQSQEAINALENIQHALEYQQTGDVYGQSIATSLELLSSVMYDIYKVLQVIADKD